MLRLLPLLLSAPALAVAPVQEQLRLQEPVAKMALSAAPAGFDPTANASFLDAIAQRPILECLTEYDYEAADDTVQGLLASSWTVSEDRLTWIFEIHPEARFYDPHDPPLWPSRSRPVRAQDVLASWLRMADARTEGRGYWAMEGLFLGLDEFRDQTAALDPAKAEAAFADAMKAGIEGIQVLDDRHLKLKLVYADAHLLKRLAMTHFEVYPLESTDTAGRTAMDQPVGSGAFHLAAWLPGQMLALQATPDWRGQASSFGDGVLPHLSRFEFHVTNTGDTSTAMFDRGETVRLGVNPTAFRHFLQEDRAALKPEFAKRGIRLLPTATADITMLQFQMDDGALGIRPGDEEGNLKRRALRQALASCFPYEDWQRLARGPIPAVQARNFLPPQIPDAAGTPASRWNRTDLDKAKKLLAEAGYPQGAGLEPILFCTSNDPVSKDLAERFQANAASVGIPLELDLRPYREVNPFIRTGGPQVFLRAWVLDYADASMVLQSFYGPFAGSVTNFPNFRDQEYDRHFLALRESLAGPARTKALLAMLEILDREVPSVPIDHRRGWVLVQPQLQNFHVHPYEYLPLKHYGWEQD